MPIKPYYKALAIMMYLVALLFSIWYTLYSGSKFVIAVFIMLSQILFFVLFLT